MYQKVECVCLVCDNCKETYEENNTGFTVFIDEMQARQEADNDGWNLHSDDGKHYCDKCHTIDDNDVLVIDTSRTILKAESEKEAEIEKVPTHYNVADNSNGFRDWLKNEGVDFVSNGHFTSIPLEGNDIFSLGCRFALYKQSHQQQTNIS